MFSSSAHSILTQRSRPARSERVRLSSIVSSRARRALELAVAFLTLEDDYPGWELATDELEPSRALVDAGARRDRRAHQARLTAAPRAPRARRGGAVSERPQHCVAPLRLYRDDTDQPARARY
ncbi:MAG TPA: hypothetical protein VLJ42_10890 [Solirubrobacteraceae bacterium]|nr:hypothetical protein [Solirubrobacteraceae bacterium]